MQSEKLLVKTKDNRILVFTINYANDAEKRRITEVCEKAIEKINYNDFNEADFHMPEVRLDVANTKFLEQEISGYHFRKQRDKFFNDLKTNNYPTAVSGANILHFDNRIADSQISEVIKNIGYRFEPVDEIYDVVYDSANEEYKIKNFKNRSATVFTGENRIEVVRNHFRLSPEDYSHMQRLIKRYEQAKLLNPKEDVIQFIKTFENKRDQSLFKIFAHEQDRLNHIGHTLAHEEQHIINAVFRSGLSLKDNQKRISVEDKYFLCTEDERSAYFKQYIRSVNLFFQGGNYNDYSMFDGECDKIARPLYKMSTDAEKIAYLTDWPNRKKDMFLQFEKHHRKNYDFNPLYPGDYTLGQFPKNLADMVKNAPLSVPDDINHEEYNRLRSLYYIFHVYNPKTHKMEPIDFSKYVIAEDKINISKEIYDNVIREKKRKLDKRLEEYREEVKTGKINPALVSAAKKLLRSSLQSSEFITEIDNFRIARLFDDDTVQQPTSGPSPTPLSRPATDKTDWSDGLQKYWQDTVGYQELAKNNNEYKFKIKDATVCYHGPKEISVSSNADFDLYVKILKEPSNKNAPIEFLDTLTEKQALTLYVACINYGRKPIGKVPTNLSNIDNLGIPAAELNKFKHRTSTGSNQDQKKRSLSTKECFNRKLQLMHTNIR